MEKDIQKYVSTCELCQLAKGTKPNRQGYLGGWKHSKVLRTVCMDLIGPIGADVSGGKSHPKASLETDFPDFQHGLFFVVGPVFYKKKGRHD